MFYFVKTPWLLKKFYPQCLWTLPTKEKKIYLTFDDGPHPEATPFVLDVLKKYHARGTFFCIGKNIVDNPALYRRILEEGHRVGNHTHNHVNGWKTKSEDYILNIREAARYIDSDLFRPPYGRISRFQISFLKSELKFRIIMWDVLSADFDKRISPEKCAWHVTAHARPGSIVIFHDSAKAFERLRVALPMVLGHFSDQGFRFESVG